MRHISEAMTEAEFEREANHLFRELGIQLPPETLNFFESDTSKKRDWKSGLKNPSPKAGRRLRPRSIVNATSSIPTSTKSPARKTSAPSATAAATRLTPREGQKGRELSSTVSSPSKSASSANRALSSNANGHAESTSYRRLSNPPRSPSSRRRQQTDGGVQSKSKHSSSSTQSHHQQQPRSEIPRPRNAAAAKPPSSFSPSRSSQAAGSPATSDAQLATTTQANLSERPMGHSRSKSESWKLRNNAPDNRLPPKFSPPITRRNAGEPASSAPYNDAHSDATSEKQESKIPVFSHADRRNGRAPVDSTQKETHNGSEQTESKLVAKSPNTQVIYNRKPGLHILSLSTSSKSSISTVVDCGEAMAERSKAKKEGGRAKKATSAAEANQRASSIPTAGSIRPRVLSAPKSSALATRGKSPVASATTATQQDTANPAHHRTEHPMTRRATDPILLSRSAPPQGRGVVYSPTSPTSDHPPSGKKHPKSPDVSSPPPLPERRGIKHPGSLPSSTSSSLSRGSSCTSPVPNLVVSRGLPDRPRALHQGGESTDGGSSGSSRAGSRSGSRSGSRQSTTPEFYGRSTPDGDDPKGILDGHLEDRSSQSCDDLSTVAITTVQALGNLVEVLTPSLEHLNKKYQFPSGGLPPDVAPLSAAWESRQEEQQRKQKTLAATSPSRLPLRTSASQPPSSLPLKGKGAEVYPELPGNDGPVNVRDISMSLDDLIADCLAGVGVSSHTRREHSKEEEALNLEEGEDFFGECCGIGV